MTACKSCGADIFFAKTIKGKTIPIDAKSRPDGNIVFGEDANTALVYNNPDAIAPRLRAEPRYVSHFATCPNADEHRKP